MYMYIKIKNKWYTNLISLFISTYIIMKNIFMKKENLIYLV